MGSLNPPLPPLGDTILFTPLSIGSLALSHRLVQSPCTRMRGIPELPGVWKCGPLTVEYYSQRATPGGLQITEATNISRLCCGYPGIPGVFTSGQLEAWKNVTDAVHAKGGYIFCQIWHVGRATVPALIEGHQTLSSSNIPIKGQAVNDDEYSDFPPRPMTVEEIETVVRDFAEAAKAAVDVAGFDGVEIHGFVISCSLPISVLY
jgi:2,4-dienoyl-CoA reductase-like NADH-dependent reductase (Old Yellow Enzyme family)